MAEGVCKGAEDGVEQIIREASSSTHTEEDKQDFGRSRTMRCRQVPRFPVRVVTQEWVRQNLPLPDNHEYIYATDAGWDYNPEIEPPIKPYRKSDRKGIQRHMNNTA